MDLTQVKGARNQSVAQFVSFPQAVEKVLSLAYKKPAEAWGLLKGEMFAGHPQRARLVCRVCRAALRLGLAREVRGAQRNHHVPTKHGSTVSDYYRIYRVPRK